MPNQTFLIISNDTAEQEYLSDLLQNFGQVNATSNMLLALTTVQIANPDLILLSAKFDEGQGYQLCEKLIGQYQVQAPIVLISDQEGNLDKKLALSVGAVDYIIQPWQDFEIIARLQKCLSFQELQQQLAQAHSDRQQLEQALQAAEARLQHMEQIDPVTQLFNRSYFYEQFVQEWRRLAREQEALSVVLCSIDYFRQYNSLYGHLAGDKCLHQVADAIRRTLKRPADLVARFGDEEFMLLLPKTDAGGAIHVARAIQLDLQNLGLVHGQSAISNHITLSIGVASTIPTLDSTPDVLVTASENAIAEAKEQGRDRIILKAYELSQS
jgi:diguanylate cyclase (GGDEF)-like protein